jgi:hypothetical protein
MRQIIDDSGRIFGKVNIIDATIILLAFVLIIGGVALVNEFGGNDDSEEQTITIEMKSIVSPAVLSALEDTDAAPEFGVTKVRNVRVEQTLDMNSSNYVNYAETRNLITFELSLKITAEDGLPHYRGSRVYIGKQLKIDLGRTLVNGSVIDIINGMEISKGQ